jgi:hypothetical protein
MSNNEAILDLIKKEFPLTEESFDLFKYFLYNQTHAEEYEMIAKAPDKRIFIDVNDDFLEFYDNSFINFKDKFSCFCYDEQLTITDWKNNLTKKNIKITKALRNWYFDKIFEKPSYFYELIDIAQQHFMDSPLLLSFFKDLFNEIFKSKDYSNYRIANNFNLLKVDDDKYQIIFTANIDEKKVRLKKKLDKQKLIKIFENLPVVNKFNLAINECYISKRINVKDIKFCISLNYADFLLASTNNPFTSCLDLKHRGYWSGLPSLIADDNRAICFITDMQEKTFRGIKSLNMIERCWIFTMINTESKNVYIMPNKMYPLKMLKDISFIKPFVKNTPLFYRFEEEPNFKTKEPDYMCNICSYDIRLHSKYDVAVFWNKIPNSNSVCTSSIYEDNFGKFFRSLDYDKIVYDTGRDNGFTSFEKKIVTEVRSIGNRFSELGGIEDAS